MKKIILAAIFVLFLFIPSLVQASSRDLVKFSVSDRCPLVELRGQYFDIKISGAASGKKVYINKMQYKLNENMNTGGRSQFRLRIPNFSSIPARYTGDINWWGDRRRDNWQTSDSWRTFWKRSYRQGKMSFRGAVWRGKFRADYSMGVDQECSFKLEL